MRSLSLSCLCSAVQWVVCTRVPLVYIQCLFPFFILLILGFRFFLLIARNYAKDREERGRCKSQPTDEERVCVCACFITRAIFTYLLVCISAQCTGTNFINISGKNPFDGFNTKRHTHTKWSEDSTKRRQKKNLVSLLVPLFIFDTRRSFFIKYDIFFYYVDSFTS